MISTVVLDAPTGSAGAGCVGASGRLRGTAAPWSALRDANAVATGSAMLAGSRVRGADAPSVVLTGEIAVGVRGHEVAQAVRPTPLFATTPYSTLGIHSPGRPQS